MSGSLKLGSLVVGASLLGGWIGYQGPEEPTRLTFLAVGQGDCAVFRTSGYTVLIDVGPNVRGFDAGTRIVVPDLRRMGVGSIDLILLSHPDMDHIGGLAAILKGLPVGRVAVSACFKEHAELLQHLMEAGCNPADVLWLGKDQSASVGGFSVEVACPPWFLGDKDNDGSEFVRITGKGASAVLTGDASSDAEDEMRPGHEWSAQVMKLGHHGSRTASSEAWLRCVHPLWAIVSCGRNNTYGHPHQQVLDRASRLGIRLARTDREGDISFRVGEHGFERE